MWSLLFGLLISQGSVAAYIRRGGQCYMSFVPNIFLTVYAVKELRRSVMFWPSYSKSNFARFVGHNVI